jgi:hypothetical protein
MRSRLIVWRNQPGVINREQRPSKSSPSSVIQYHSILSHPVPSNSQSPSTIQFSVLRAGHIQLPNLNVFVKVILFVRSSNRHPSWDPLGLAESLAQEESFLEFDSGLLQVQLQRLGLQGSGVVLRLEEGPTLTRVALMFSTEKLSRLPYSKQSQNCHEYSECYICSHICGKAATAHK